MMSHEHLYDVWAPDYSIWSRWAKPVLFAQPAPPAPTDDVLDWQRAEVSWAPSSSERQAIVLDVNGPLAVNLGLALAAQGYRPVPLFNTSHGPNAVINVEKICSELFSGAEVLRDLRIDRDAPPVFLLDSNRIGSSKSTPRAGDYDNRWLVFPQDFPSANFLLSQQIPRVLVIRHLDDRLPDDISHVLRRWQEAGIKIYVKNLSSDAAATHIDVPRPPFYRAAWHRFLVLFRVRRNSAGGFGAVVPEVASGTG
jgi:hypothetical protein